MTSETPSSLETEMRAAMKKQSWVEVISLIETHWTDLTQTNQGVLVDAVNALPATVLAQNPRLSAAKTYVNYLPVNGDVRPVRFRHAPVAAQGTLLDILADLTSRSVSARFEGDLTLAASLVHKALGVMESVADDDIVSILPVLPDIREQWAITLQLSGELVEANRMYERTFDEALAVDNWRISTKAAGSIALNYALAGTRLTAEQWLKREPHSNPDGLRVIEPLAVDTVRTTGGLARALLAANDLRLDEATAALRSAPSAEVDRETWALRLFVESLVARASGQARQQLLQVSTTLGSQPERHRSSGLNGWLATTTITELQLAAGDVAAAHKTLGGLDSYGPLTVVNPALVPRAWVALRRGDPRRALLLASTGLSQPMSSPRVVAELRVALAAASLALGERDNAFIHFDAAMEVIGPEKLAIVLLRLTAAERATLLAAHSTALEPRVIVALNAHEPTIAASSAARLTKRERVVLRYVIQGLGPTEIAAAEQLSRNTVKAQVRSLYRKLGVTDREGALSVALSTPHLLA